MTSSDLPNRRQWLARCAALASTGCCARFIGAQAAVPLKLIVQAPAGNTLDTVTRAVAVPLGRSLSRPIVVLNRPGAGGLVAAREVAASAPDGNTVLMSGSSALTVLPLTQPEAGVELEPIAVVADLPLVLAVGPGLNVSDLAQLIALARRRPGALSYAANTAGTVPHLAGQRLAQAAGVELTFVSYSGGAPQALADVAQGRVSFIIEALPGLGAALRSGLVKPLAVLSERRLASHPDLPTMAETLPGLAITGWMALVAPKGTPLAATDRLSDALEAVLGDRDLSASLREAGAYPAFQPREALARRIDDEQRHWRPLLARAAASGPTR